MDKIIHFFTLYFPKIIYLSSVTIEKNLLIELNLNGDSKQSKIPIFQLDYAKYMLSYISRLDNVEFIILFLRL